MATRDDIQLAQKVITDVNRMTETLRNAATITVAIKSNIDGLVAIASKKDKLIAGLSGLDVGIAALKTDYESAAAKAQEVLDTIAPVTTY